jgi:hypothetical protein
MMDMQIIKTIMVCAQLMAIANHDMGKYYYFGKNYDYRTIHEGMLNIFH